jgi:hypothetical protein
MSLDAAAAELDSKISALRRELTQDIRKPNPARTMASSAAFANAAAESEASKVKKLQLRVQSLESDLKRRQVSYVRRERDLRAEIAELEAKVEKLRMSSGSDQAASDQMEEIRKLHSGVMASIGTVQSKTAHMLHDQEKDLLRAFRARLYDVQSELEKERSRSDGDEAAQWQGKYRSLEGEVEWIKGLADKLEQTNKHLVKHNTTLKAQFESQEEDRALLIKQLVLAKKDNARLRQEYLAMRESLEGERGRAEKLKLQLQGQLKLQSLSRGKRALSKRGDTAILSGGRHATDDSDQLSDRRSNQLVGGAASQRLRGGVEMDTSAAGRRQRDAAKTEKRLRDLLAKQKKMLDQERRSLRRARNDMAQEVRARTELEMLLRQCLDDVRSEVARRMDVAPNAVELSEFDRAARERTMELLLSQERVVALLYSRTFPDEEGEVGRGKVTGSSAHFDGGEGDALDKMLRK